MPDSAEPPAAAAEPGLSTAPRRRRPPKWLLHQPQTEAPVRLFCVPYSGTGASMYHRWPLTLGPAEVCAVQLPGRENRMREPHYGDYRALAEGLVDYLEPLLDRPFAFFGHCGGALPAVETARVLAERGMPSPVRLFISSQVAPQDGPYGRFLGLTDDELRHEIEVLTRKLGGTPNASLLELGLSILKADIEANRQYRFDQAPQLPTAITSIGWDRDVEVPPSLMTGWAACTENLHSVVLPGEHYDFLAGPAPLLDLLAADLQAEVSPAPAHRTS